MNPVLQMIINALLKYLESHPEEVEKLVEAAINAIIKAIDNSSSITKK